MHQIYRQESPDEGVTVEEATVMRSRLGTPSDVAQPLGLMLRLSSPRGVVIAFFTDLNAIWDLLASFGASRPEDLEGKKVLAHFQARRLVGISSR